MSAITHRTDLVSIADRANQAHRDCELAYGSALAYAFDAGAALLEAKSQLHHGQWLPWLEEHIEFEERVAQRYMRLAEHREILNTKDTSDLGIEAALKMISTPRKLSAGEMGQVFAGAQPEPREPDVRHKIEPVGFTAQQERKDIRAKELLDHAELARHHAHKPGLVRGSIARAYRDAAVRAQRAAALLDELAISFER